MPSNNPQVSIRLTPEEYKYLQELAERNFVTLPQFVKILVKRELARDKNDRTPPPPSNGEASQPDPPKQGQRQPTKRGKGKEG